MLTVTVKFLGLGGGRGGALNSEISITAEGGGGGGKCIENQFLAVRGQGFQFRTFHVQLNRTFVRAAFTFLSQGLTLDNL